MSQIISEDVRNVLRCLTHTCSTITVWPALIIKSMILTLAFAVVPRARSFVEPPVSQPATMTKYWTPKETALLVA